MVTMNTTISYSSIRKNLKKNLDKVCSDHVPLLVTRKNGENVVVISESDYSSLEETIYLSQSPKNLERLLKAINTTDQKGYSWDEVKNELGI